ncbi:unnamed protein product [Vitrella brassicaformis CCMP3155]|uniref:Uncharacterized protein n=1 Tax=Vitrella brassicaformis (strain CCMP3155) TaxID=1169540 RepID=A0A0G4EBN2_VITBC|nr:unnamed protein product [Vitrella brassicaformis CCMP3155]|eukprot:CEL92700.1 unnamed protein product [Vitrella brassicaformis CCMP3155]
MSVGEMTHLYRQILRTANRFDDKNFRLYFIRRAHEDFRSFYHSQESKSLGEEGEGEGRQSFLRRMEEHLAMLQRQTAIGHMYWHEGIHAKR